MLVGSSGSGKTETCKRLAFGAAQVYGWKVFYLDCKGDDDTAAQFQATMHAAGRAVARFPTVAYDGWRGDATAILNRLMLILDFSEPYYRDMTKMLLSLASRTSQFDSVAALILTLGVLQFVRGTMRGRIIAGLRAAVIGVALTLAMLTPWVLTICIVASALLVALQLVDTRGISNHRHP
jgi:hypothetical protein